MTSKTTYQSFFDSTEAPPCSCLIAGLGTENRNSIKVINDLISKYSDADCYVLIVNSKQVSQLDEVCQKLSIKAKQVIVLEYNEKNELYENGLRDLVSYFYNDDNDASIVFEVTGIQREHMVMFLYILRAKSNIKVTISSISGTYGEHKITNYLAPQNIRFFEGSPRISLPTAIILLPGYEAEASRILLNWYQPTKLFIGFGEKPVEAGQQLPERLRIDDLISDYTGNPDIEIIEFEYDAGNPENTFRAIDKLISDNELVNQYNLLFASTSTKLSTIGMYLAHEKYPVVQFVSTRGLETTDITKDILNIFMFELPNRSVLL